MCQVYSYFLVFLHYFVKAKLDTSSMSVKMVGQHSLYTRFLIFFKQQNLRNKMLRGTQLTILESILILKNNHFFII